MFKKLLFSMLLSMSIVRSNAQEGSPIGKNYFQNTQKGAMYQVLTNNPGIRIRLNDVVTFQFIQKTDKDSVLYSTYVAGHPVQAQVQPSQSVGDLMEIFPLLTVNDSAIVKVPTDSIFKGHEDQRPAIFPKGSNTTFILKIEKVQSLNEATSERNTTSEKTNVPQVQTASEWADKAKEEIHVNNYEQAIADCNKAISLDPALIQAYLARGYAENELGRYSNALLDFDQVISLGLKAGPVYIYRGISKLQLKKYLAAISDFNQALAIDPKSETAYRHRSISYSSLGKKKVNYQKAIADYDMSIQLGGKPILNYREDVVKALNKAVE